MLSTLWFVFVTIVTKSIIWSIIKYFQWHNNSNSKHCWNSIIAKKMSIIRKPSDVHAVIIIQPQRMKIADISKTTLELDKTIISFNGMAHVRLSLPLVQPV